MECSCWCCQCHKYFGICIWRTGGRIVMSIVKYDIYSYHNAYWVACLEGYTQTYIYHAAIHRKKYLWRTTKMISCINIKFQYAKLMCVTKRYTEAVSAYVHRLWWASLGEDLAYCIYRWRHQMEKFSAFLALCAGNSPVTGEFPSQVPVTRSFDVFFDLTLNKRLTKQSWCRWFETL